MILNGGSFYFIEKNGNKINVHFEPTDKVGWNFKAKVYINNRVRCWYIMANPTKTTCLRLIKDAKRKK